MLQILHKGKDINKYCWFLKKKNESMFPLLRWVIWTRGLLLINPLFLSIQHANNRLSILGSWVKVSMYVVTAYPLLSQETSRFHLMYGFAYCFPLFDTYLYELLRFLCVILALLSSNLLLKHSHGIIANCLIMILSFSIWSVLTLLNYQFLCNFQLAWYYWGFLLLACLHSKITPMNYNGLIFLVVHCILNKNILVLYFNISVYIKSKLIADLDSSKFNHMTIKIVIPWKLY